MRLIFIILMFSYLLRRYSFLFYRGKFLRCLLGVLKKTQDNPPSVWAYIPVQNFTSISDIDWDLPLSEIDKILYKKYNLTEDEIDFIETTVKPME